MKFLRIIVIAAVFLAAAVAEAANDPARFWISTSKDSPIVGEAPSINAAVGRQRTLYIWAQPATDAAGAFRTIQDFSLDIVTQAADRSAETQPFIDFVDGSFIVYNPSRFQYVSDSLRSTEQGGPLTSGPADVSNGQPDSVKGLQGLSITTTNMVGIGNASDPYRVGNAWRVAEVGFKSLPVAEGNTLTNTLFLQIGYAGMLSQGTGDTNVLLGNDVASETTTYDATCPKQNGCSSQRQQTLSGDTFDIQITEVPFSPGDYNGDGVIGAADYTYWRTSFGQTVTNNGDGGDGNNNSKVDAADYVFWRKKATGPSGSAAGISALQSEPNVVPEPGTAALASILIATLLFVVWQRRPARSVSER